MSDETIYCARCGAAGQQPESYCRSCGEWLPDINAAGSRRGRLRLGTPAQRHRKMRMLEALGALASLSAVVLLLSVLASGSPQPLMVIAAQLCIVAFAFQVMTFFIGRGLQKRAEKGRDELPAFGAAETPQLPAAETSDLLRPPSVTESTTALLDPVPLQKGRKG